MDRLLHEVIRAVRRRTHGRVGCAVTIVAQIATLVAAGVHLLAFVWESVLLRRPSVTRGHLPHPRQRCARRPSVGVQRRLLQPVPRFRRIAGVILWWAGHDTPGRTLVVYTCLFMFLAGIALALSNRMALSRQRGDGVVGALSQSVPPLVALIALAIG